VGLAEKPQAGQPWEPHEPIVEQMCTGNSNDGQPRVVNAGIPYQELSKLTGGLRFPICQWTSYDAVFQAVAADVIGRFELACDFPVPPPKDKSFNPEKLALEYAPAAGEPLRRLAQAFDAMACEPDLFYVDEDRIFLCPDACTALREAEQPNVRVLFTCEPQIRDPQ
jgi:hypothetical protein